MTNTLDIQRRLLALGYDPGPTDGVLGRRTIRAIRAFQLDAGLEKDGVAGPKTVAAMNEHGGISPAHPALSKEITPPWIENVERVIGLQEKRDNKQLRDYLDSDGETVGDPARIPWCGDTIQTPLALTLPDEALPANPYYALNWAEWGVEVPHGMVPLGAVGTKARKGGGHVFFIVGHDATYFHALGGNQSNSICIVKIRKSDLHGTLRWPSTYPLPTRSLPETTIEATINASEA
jgi:uncharacterized protein (TIGR02594 family)